MKMRLAAKAPNEGARRLAWWIGEHHRGDVDYFADIAQIETSLVERLIAGEIVPGTDLALRVGLGSDGYVSRVDWQRAPIGTWFERPSARPRLLAMVHRAA